MKRSLVFSILAGLVVVAGTAIAQYVGGNPWHGNETGEVIILKDGSTRRYLTGQTNGAANVFSIDRDDYTVFNTTIQNLSLADSGQYKCTEVISIGSGYETLGIYFSASIADSDSVAVDIYMYGKTSASVSDGLDFSIDTDMTNAQNDGILVLASGSAAAGYATTTAQPVSSTAHVIRNETGGSCAFIQWPFPVGASMPTMLYFEVENRSTTDTIDSLSIDVIAKKSR